MDAVIVQSEPERCLEHERLEATPLVLEQSTMLGYVDLGSTAFSTPVMLEVSSTFRTNVDLRHSVTFSPFH